MRGIILLAVSQCISLTAFCQSATKASGPAQNSFGGSSSPQSLFTFSGGPGSQSFPFKFPSCDGAKADPRLQKASPDPNQLFHSPCMDPQIFALNAQNNLQAPALPGGKWPHAKSIPIPTEWPNAKFEPIPTEWPNLKVLPIERRSATRKPAR